MSFLFNRLLASVLGAGCGLLLFVAWELLSRGHGWPFHGAFLASAVKWYVFIGALVGLLGGAKAVAWLWEHAVGQAESEASSMLQYALVVIVLVGGVALFLVWSSRL